MTEDKEIKDEDRDSFFDDTPAETFDDVGAKKIPDPEVKAKESRHAPKEPGEEKDTRPRITINKYSQGPSKKLYESIFVDNKPFFAYATDEKLIKVIEEIPENYRILKPPSEDECLSRPYKFESDNELLELWDLAKKTTINDLFSISRKIWSEYFYHKPYIIDLLAADTIISYFQDKFSTTFYLFIIGENASGKGTVIELMDLIAYRAFRSASISYASLYRILTNIEHGQITMLLDEVNRLSDEAMEIHKSGYKPDNVVTRSDESGKGLKVTKFFTFGHRIFVAEKAFDGDGAKGLNERCFYIHSIKGRTRKQLWKVTSPHNEKKYHKRLQEIDRFRKLCLLYRLATFKDTDKFKDVEVSHKYREEELIGPMLSLFYNSEYQNNIVYALNMCLRERNKVKQETIEAIMYDIIIRLRNGEEAAENPERKKLLDAFNESNPQSFATSLERIDDLLLQEIDGQWKYGSKDEPTRNTMISNRFGDISGKHRTSILRDKFYAVHTRFLSKTTGGTFKAWIFPNENLDSLKDSYTEYQDLKVLGVEDSTEEDYSSGI